MPMNDDDFMAVFTGQAKVSKQRYSVIPDMGTDTSYIEQERKKNASESAIDFPRHRTNGWKAQKK